MDVAYPLRHKRPGRYDPLVWSLRSLVHIPHDRVFLAGGFAKEVDPTKVIHIPVADYGEKWTNAAANLRAVLESDISEDFIWMNDDFFFHQDMKTVPLYHRETIGETWERLGGDGRPKGSFEHQNFVAGMLSQVRVLRDWGFSDDTPNCDLHVPIVLNKTRLKEVLDYVKASHPKHPVGHFRALYGAGLSSERLADPKIKKIDRMPSPSWPFISSNEGSFRSGAVGKYVRFRYWQPSPYEAVRA